MPVDGFSLQVVPRADGAVYIDADGETVRGRVVSSAGPNTVKVWQNHFVTCPELVKERPKKTESWNETQSRLVRERVEKERAEAAAKAARRAEKERKEAEAREAADAQYSMFGT